MDLDLAQKIWDAMEPSEKNFCEKCEEEIFTNEEYCGGCMEIVLNDHFKERLARLEKLLAFWKTKEDCPEKRHQIKTLEESIEINKQLIRGVE